MAAPRKTTIPRTVRLMQNGKPRVTQNGTYRVDQRKPLK